jgi:hypothetical protein
VRQIDRRTVVLGVAAAGAVAAAVVVTVQARGSSESASHRRVSAYIKQVDGVQQSLGFRLTRLLAAYRGFTTGNAGPRVRSQLAEAERTLRTVERRVRALEPPPEARQLHRLIVRLLALDGDVAHEVFQIATFSPEFRRVLAGAVKASRQLSTELAGVKFPTPHQVHGSPAEIAKARADYHARATAAAVAQADAVEKYCAALASVLTKMRALRPPPVLAPELQTQERAFAATRKAGLTLGAGLRSSDLSQVPALSRRFSVAARSAGSVASQRAQIAAIKAYNARVRQVGALGAQIRKEVTRLQQAVG